MKETFLTLPMCSLMHLRQLDRKRGAHMVTSPPHQARGGGTLAYGLLFCNWLGACRASLVLTTSMLDRGLSLSLLLLNLFLLLLLCICDPVS